MELQSLFQPITIRSLTLKNRIIMPTLDPGFAGAGGEMTQRLIDYFKRRAEGGVSFILVGPAVFDPVGVGGTFEFRIYRQQILDGLARLADAIHSCGIPVGLQMHHAGRQANPDLIEGASVAPSAVPCPLRRTVPHALSVAGIEDIIEQYGIYAQKAKQIGFDALEVHGSHGYLICQFCSPLSNTRTDAYGGSLENRARFGVQIIREVRKNVGSDTVILYRVPGEEHVPGGLTMEETPLIARIMEEAGADVINVSAGTYQAAEWIVPPMTLPRGCNVPAAKEIKKKVKIPLAVSGRISPEMGEQLIRAGQADLISIARGLVADPDLPSKAKAGKLREIRRCIACNACIDRLFWEKDIVCTLNPAVGREKEFEIGPAPAAKKIMVIGGGPAGLEAARTARLRGHDVDLYEADAQLGGRIDAASKAAFKKELKGIADYYEAVLDSLGVRVHLNAKMTPERARSLKPDAVVIAMGATPLVPDIPGIESPRVVQALDALLDRVRVEGQAAVIGGGMVGCEAAVYLAEKGAKVTILEMLPYVAYGIPRLLGKMVKEDMKNMGIRTMTGCKVLEIQNGEVIYEKDGKKAGLKTQWVVLSLGARAQDQSVEAFKKLFKEVYAIGDCAEPRKALDAIREGARIGGAI